MPATSIPAEPAAFASERLLAERLASGDLRLALRYVPEGPASGWRRWDGSTWAHAPGPVPVALAGAIRREAGALLGVGQIDLRTARGLESTASMRTVLTQLQAREPMRFDPAQVDLPGTLAMPSHVIELQSGERLAHDPARMITRCTAVNPGPTCDLWQPVEDHLRACLGSLYPQVHRFLGSSLLGRGADRPILWLHGDGGDGKSTLAKLLRAALGDYLAIVPAEVFSDGTRSAHLHEIGSGLSGARLAIALDVGDRLGWQRLKSLSRGDEQVSKRLYGRAYTYARPPCIVLVSNHPPCPPDHASAERLIVARLAPPVDPDERIMAILKDGGPERDALAGACLSWLLKGCADYLQHGLGPMQTAARR